MATPGRPAEAPQIATRILGTCIGLACLPFQPSVQAKGRGRARGHYGPCWLPLAVSGWPSPRHAKKIIVPVDLAPPGSSPLHRAGRSRSKAGALP
jgi:hypothetical protein